VSIAVFIFVLTAFLIVYVGGNYYIACRLFQWLSLLLPNINAKIFIGIFILIALSVILRFMPLPPGVKNVVNWAGAYWMGIFLYLLLFMLALDFVIFIGGIMQIIPFPIPQSIIFYKGLIAIMLAAVTVSYGLYNATQVKYVSYDVQTRESVLAKEIKIVLISDLHLEGLKSEQHFANIVQGVNRLQPDIVCIAGDIFNNGISSLPNPSEVMDMFKSIEARYGVYACLGNHDGGSEFDEMLRFLALSNVKLLNDEYTIVDDRFILIGRLDSSSIGGYGSLRRKNLADIMVQVDTNYPVIVMDHNPAHVEEYGNEIDLILSGHTHRGQLFPGRIITNAIFVVDYGHYQKDADSPHIIVTSGVCPWGTPMRVGSQNEIVSIILR